MDSRQTIALSQRFLEARLEIVRFCALLLTVLSLAGLPIAANAQDLEIFDPDDAFAQPDSSAGAIDADLQEPARQPDPVDELSPITSPEDSAPPVFEASGTPESATSAAPETEAAGSEANSAFGTEFANYADDPELAANAEGNRQWVDPASGASVGAESEPAVAEADPSTYGQDDLIGAAEGVFGKGAQGLARMIEDLLEKEGKPNGYIVGREAGGAFIIGARYGSGMLHHKVEGERKVYWTGPSVGIDAGANAANTFVLVYNLYDTEDLFKRYPAGEGQAYLVGGLHASYVRRGDVVLIPIRMGAGLRLGLNAGYMKFSKKQRWLPF